MADQNVTELTDATSVAAADTIYVQQGGADREAAMSLVKEFVLGTPVAVVGNATAGAELRLPEDTDNGAHYVAIKAPNSLTGTYTLTLPVDDGGVDEFLKSDGSGNLSWATVGGVTAPLTLASGTITDPSAALTITQTWNDAADTFTALDVNVTNTASNALSKLLDLRVGGTTMFSFNRGGNIAIGGSDYTVGGIGWHNNGGERMLLFYGGGNGASPKALLGGGSFINFRMPNNGALGFSSEADPKDGNPDAAFFRSAAGVISVRGSATSVGGALNFLERTAPSAPSTDQVVIYAADNGSGKTQLMALFATGAAQQIAIEP